jgi:hypothetical protein
MSARAESNDLLQEEDHVSRLAVVLGMIVTLAIAAAMVVWAWATNAQVTAALRPAGDREDERLEPSKSPPRVNELLFGQPGEGERLLARQRRWLTSYRWLDESRRIVTLPIDEAMDRIAAESSR